MLQGKLFKPVESNEGTLKMRDRRREGWKKKTHQLISRRGMRRPRYGRTQQQSPAVWKSVSALHSPLDQESVSHRHNKKALGDRWTGSSRNWKKIRSGEGGWVTCLLVTPGADTTSGNKNTKMQKSVAKPDNCKEGNRKEMLTITDRLHHLEMHKREKSNRPTGEIQ